MDAVDQLHHQSLDVSNFETLFENAQKPLTKGAEVQAAVDANVRTQIDRIRQYATSNPDGPLVEPNGGLLGPAAAVDSWSAGPGSFSVTSAYSWAVGGGVPFLGQIPLGFLFGGKGSSWKAWATGTAPIGGSFVLDPNEICLSSDFHTEESSIGVVRKGKCNFTASGGGVGISGLTISLYSVGGAFWGTLGGSGAIVGGFSVEGELDLVWQGWKQ